jgi:general secretion pathway protein G
MGAKKASAFRQSLVENAQGRSSGLERVYQNTAQGVAAMWPILRYDRRGFTLIELMVVIIILGILAMWVAPKIMSRPGEAKQVKAKLDIQNLETALKLYKLDNGVYPSTEQGLQALVEKPETGVIPKKWKKGGYLEKGRVPKDPWGNDFVYLSPGLKGDFDILSYGADGVPGGEDENKDVNNWDIE